MLYYNLFKINFVSFLEGIAFGPNNTLYVASFLNDQVVKYTKYGEYLGVVSSFFL